MKKACGSHGVPRIYFQLLYLQHKANTMWAASCCGAKHGEKNSSRSAFPNQNECHRLPFNIDIVEPKEWGPGPCQFWRSIALFGFASNVKVINHDKPQFRLQIHLHFLQGFVLWLRGSLLLRGLIMVDLHHHVVGFEIFKTGAFHCIPPWPLNHGKYPLISWENDMENFFS